MSQTKELSADEARFLTLLAKRLDRHDGRFSPAGLRFVNARREAGAAAFSAWSDEELYAHAGRLGVQDRFGMSRRDLIAALESH